MNEYVVCFATHGRTWSPAVRRVLDAADHDFLPFSPSRHRRWTSDDGLITYAGWETGPEPATVIDHRGLVAISGLPRPRTGRWNVGVPLVAHVAAAVRSGGSVANAHTIATATNDGAEIWADPFGTACVYIGRTEEVVAVGNRSALVAAVLAAGTAAPPRRDLLGAAFTAWGGFKLGRRTGFEGVEFVEPGHRVVAADGRVDVVAPRDHLLRGADTDPPTLDDVIEEIVSSLYFALDREPGRPVIELTGGKDSRLTLAVAVLAGLQNDFDVLTRGAAHTTDRSIARILAAKAGVTTSEPTRVLRRLGFVDRVRAHVQRTDGLISAHDNSHPDPDRRLTVSSHAGEIMRGRPASETDPTTAEEVGRQLAWMGFGKHRYVLPEVAAEFARETEALLLRGGSLTDDPAEFREVFESCFRSRWMGVRPDAGPPRVLSLFTLAGARYAWSQDRTFRLTEPVHHPLIERAGRGLLEVPLGKGTWNRSPEVVPSPESAPRDSSPPPRPATLAAAAADERRTGPAAGRLAVAMRELFREHHDSPAWDVLDRELVNEHAGRFGSLDQNARSQLLGALTAVVWLDEGEAGAREEWIS